MRLRKALSANTTCKRRRRGKRLATDNTQFRNQPQRPRVGENTTGVQEIVDGVVSSRVFMFDEIGAPRPS
jgi:hypothetical protein